MKKTIYFVTYLAAAIIGILLLIFNQQAQYDIDAPALHGLTIATGIIFVIPGITMLCANFRPAVNNEGVVVNRPWYSTLTAIVALIWGISLLSMSARFTEMLPVTIGISLIIAGCASVIWTLKASRPYGTAFSWYIFPILTFLAGILCLIFVAGSQTAMDSGALAAIVGGAVLVFFGCNGMLSVLHSSKVKKEIRLEKKEAELERKEEEKESAK